MKFILSLIILTAFHSASAAAVNTWTSQGHHPLWDALDVEIIYSKGLPSYEIKEVGGVSCTKSGEDYTCSIPQKMDATQLRAFYKAIKTEPQDTNGAYTEYKIVGKMIFTGTAEENSEYSNYDDMFVIYLDHPCQSVQSKKDATACMEFWASKVLPSFNEENDVVVVTATKDVLAKAKTAINWVHGDYKLFNDRIQTADYIGMMNEHMDEDHLYYFVIQKGENVIPLEALDLNIADLGYMFEEIYKNSPEKGKDAFLAYFTKNLFLGKDNVGHFGDSVIESFDYFWEEYQEERLIDEP